MNSGVSITGMAIWCALGRDLTSYEEALRQGRCGRRRVERFDVADPFFRTTEAASLQDEKALQPKVDESMIADLAITVAQEAVVDAGKGATDVDPRRLGVAFGTSHGGNIAFMRLMRGRMGLPGGRIDAGLALTGTPAVTGRLARSVGARGPTVVISTACASGTNSIGRAAELIQAGRADVMVAGGADLFTELSFSGFNMLGATAPNICRPLDRDRDGMMLGDGAAMVVLESTERAKARGARIYAQVVGHAIANEAYHATAPRPDGASAARVMEQALRSAGVSPDAIDYINVHGTGTAANDEAEMRGIQRLFGERARKIWLSSTKSMVGHTLGAAGSVELVTTALAIAHGFVPPTINLANPIPDFADYAYVRDQAIPGKVRYALSNSLAFAGNIASIVLAEAA
jgi:3-oxoacyl-[acyl-carrier-protein] synthase II